MKLNVLLVLNAIFFAASGLLAMLSPETVLSLYGVVSDPAVELMAQYAGLGSLAISLIAWVSRKLEASQLRKTILPALLITYLAGAVISILGTLSGIMKLGWVVVGLYSLFAALYAYSLLSKVSGTR